MGRKSGCDNFFQSFLLQSILSVSTICCVPCRWSRAGIYLSVSQLTVLMFAFALGSLSLSFKMQNASGQYVDLYVPRKCSWTNRLIHSSDYAAVTVNIARVDADSGQRLPENDTFCLSGYIRSKVREFIFCSAITFSTQLCSSSSLLFVWL